MFTSPQRQREGKAGPRAELLGEGLINSEGAFHMRERKLCTPAFQPHHIAPFADTMRELPGGDILIDLTQFDVIVPDDLPRPRDSVTG